MKRRHLPANAQFSFMVGSLTSLLSQVPAPPAVRAAAFRTLASLPSVRSLGPVSGGQALLIGQPGGAEKMIVDPAAALLRSEVWLYKSAAEGTMRTKGLVHFVIAQWTNRLPKVVPLPPK